MQRAPAAAAVVALSVLVTLTCDGVVGVGPSRNHGPVVMGISNDVCDNGKWRLWVDWDNSTDYEYRCQPDEQLPVLPLNSRKRAQKSDSTVSCIPNEAIPEPLHKCMTESIEYDDQPPRGGPHRPLWPVYGEYLYVPPQRWIHSMEHGGVVFLYHPCADSRQVAKLKLIARSCLRRYIITPYRQLPSTKPLAIVTYGCRMLMSAVDLGEATTFVKNNALNPERASEADVWKDGQYTAGLIRQSSVPFGSDVHDSNLCPASTS